MSPSHPSILALDTYVLGGLSAAERAQTAQHLKGCEACRARVASIEADKNHFDDAVLPGALPRLRAAAAPRTFTLPRALGLGLALAAGLAALVVWAPRAPAPDGVKGGPAFQVVARHGTQVLPVRGGEHLSPGDALRFVAEPGGRAYLLVVSADASGGVSVYQPYGGAESAPISGARVELPGSIVLDSSKGPERLWALFSDAPIPVSDLRPQLQALAGHPGALREHRMLRAPHASEVTVWFEKGSP